MLRLGFRTERTWLWSVWKKKIMVWLKNSLFTTQMDGSVPRSPYKNIQFCRHESSWKYPKMSLKILSGVTQTAVTHLAVLLASI